MKVVITGASGLLGRALMQRFSSLNPVGYAFSRAANGLRKVDLTQFDQVTKALSEDQPDIIIHAAAERRPDVCAGDEALALKINVDATRHLAEQAKALGAWLLYISTDYVFDGTKPPYHPDDTPNPLNFYGRSKLAGEREIQRLLSHYGILRVGILYGEVQFLAESAVTALLPLLDAKETVLVDDYCQRYPLHTLDVAEACWVLAQRAADSENFSGIWHWCTPTPLTKYAMLKIMAEKCGRSMSHIKAAMTPQDSTPRPVDCAFDCQALLDLGVAPPQAFNSACVSATNVKLC